jgi:hypothetical protein
VANIVVDDVLNYDNRMFRSPEQSTWPTIRRHGLSTKWRRCGAISVTAIAAVDHRVLLEVSHMKNQIAALLLVVGCASSGANRLYQSSFLAVLTVTNQRTEDETIYVMHAGYKGRRLGQVNGLASATFELTPADAANASDVQFLAMASLSGATEVSQSVTAERGARYKWELAAGRGHQFLSFRLMPK